MNRLRGLAFVLALVLIALTCGRDDDVDIELDPDSLVPPDAAERLERTGRRVGGKVGEALEETGEAIERAGERIQEEVAEGEEPDTLVP